METNTINLTLPIKISYEVLRQLMDAKLIGMEIGNGNRKQGKIVDIGLEASPLPEYDIVLGLRLQIIRKIVLAKEVLTQIHITLAYEPDTGRLSVGTFKMDSKSKNFLVNKTLNILANRIYYQKVLEKAIYNLNEIIGPQLSVLNEKLRSGVHFSQGMVLQGNLGSLTILGIEPGPNHVLVHAQFKGAAELAVEEIPG